MENESLSKESRRYWSLRSRPKNVKVDVRLSSEDGKHRRFYRYSPMTSDPLCGMIEGFEEGSFDGMPIYRLTIRKAQESECSDLENRYYYRLPSMADIEANYLNNRQKEGMMGFPKTLEEVAALIEDVLPITKALEDFERSGKATSNKQGYGKILYDFALYCAPDRETRKKFFVEAAKNLQECFETDEKDILSGSLSSLIYCRHLRDFEKGQDLVRKVVDSYNRGNKDHSGYLAYSLLYCFKEGVELAKAIMDRHPKETLDAKGVYVKGLMMAKDGHLDDALECFEASCEIDPFDLEVLDTVVYHMMLKGSQEGLYSYFKNRLFDKLTI